MTKASVRLGVQVLARYDSFSLPGIDLFLLDVSFTNYQRVVGDNMHMQNDR